MEISGQICPWNMFGKSTHQKIGCPAQLSVVTQVQDLLDPDLDGLSQLLLFQGFRFNLAHGVKLSHRNAAILIGW